MLFAHIVVDDAIKPQNNTNVVSYLNCVYSCRYTKHNMHILNIIEMCVWKIPDTRALTSSPATYSCVNIARMSHNHITCRYIYEHRSHIHHTFQDQGECCQHARQQRWRSCVTLERFVLAYNADDVMETEMTNSKRKSVE